VRTLFRATSPWKEGTLSADIGKMLFTQKSEMQSFNARIDRRAIVRCEQLCFNSKSSGRAGSWVISLNFHIHAC
jgi:hypothetical protein